ncbi:hypothetical protein V6N11_080465 [Hibiscus sabdariffa]|uniref:Reverse transcriptase n=1 Tax=Hibiscus sabdariffa TaxID=183260 RepID=A0ABR2R822_9ROSI
MERIHKKCDFSHGLDISSNVSRGGLSIGWKDDVSISIRSFSLHHIDLLILDNNGSSQWRLTGFYGGLVVQDKVHSWSLLRQLNDSPLIPWIQWQLVYLGMGRTTANYLRAGLDRGVVNSAWECFFLDYRVDHLPHLFSDHCPFFLNTCPNLGQPQQFWHFRFEAFWLLESFCEVEVKHLWTSFTGSVSLGLDRWFRKIRR